MASPSLARPRLRAQPDDTVHPNIQHSSRAPVEKKPPFRLLTKSPSPSTRYNPRQQPVLAERVRPRDDNPIAVAHATTPPPPSATRRASPGTRAVPRDAPRGGQQLVAGNGFRYFPNNGQLTDASATPAGRSTTGNTTRSIRSSKTPTRAGPGRDATPGGVFNSEIGAAALDGHARMFAQLQQLVVQLSQAAVEDKRRIGHLQSQLDDFSALTTQQSEMIEALHRKNASLVKERDMWLELQSIEQQAHRTHAAGGDSTGPVLRLLKEERRQRLEAEEQSAQLLLEQARLISRLEARHPPPPSAAALLCSMPPSSPSATQQQTQPQVAKQQEKKLPSSDLEPGAVRRDENGNPPDVPLAAATDGSTPPQQVLNLAPPPQLASNDAGAEVQREHAVTTDQATNSIVGSAANDSAGMAAHSLVRPRGQLLMPGESFPAAPAGILPPTAVFPLSAHSVGSVKESPSARSSAGSVDKGGRGNPPASSVDVVARLKATYGTPDDPRTSRSGGNAATHYSNGIPKRWAYLASSASNTSTAAPASTASRADAPPSLLPAAAPVGKIGAGFGDVASPPTGPPGDSAEASPQEHQGGVIGAGLEYS